jgi:hypothetical protein
MAKSIYDIDPSKIKIAGKDWDDDTAQLLAAREILLFSKCSDYWQPILERGRKLENYYLGNIFTPEQRAFYEHNEQIPIELAIMKAPIRALIGQCLKSRKSGQVVTERGATAGAEDNTKELETLNIVLKDIETKTREPYMIREALTGAFVSAYWNVLLFDKCRPSRNSDGARYKMTNLPWSSCVFGPPTARQPDGSDIKELFFYDCRSIADLLDNFPDMETQILEHFNANDRADNKMLSSIDQWEGLLTVEERDTMWSVLEGANNARQGSQGLAKVIMHLYPVKQKQDVWVNLFDDTGEDFEIRPPDWDDERWNRWIMENQQKYGGPYEQEVITLWMTVFTTSGLVLANEPHFFQENGMLPCSFWLGAMDANKPTGPAVDMATNCLAASVAETSYLDDLRNGSGRLWVVKAGAVESIDNLATEANKPVGVAIVSKDFNAPLNEAIQEKVRTPNTHWKTYAEQHKSLMVENTRINEAMLGGHAPRQSAIAKESEISQALTVNATYIDNLNACWNYHQNLKLKLIPYFYDSQMVIEVSDDDGNDMMAEVNVPDTYDIEGNVTSVVNDLTANRYRWRINPVDDSATAKVRSMEDALIFLNGAAGPVLQADPSGTLLAELMSATSNPMLMKAGKKMAELAQQSSQAAATAEQQKSAIEQIAKLAKSKADLIRSMKHGNITSWQAENMNDYPELRDLWLKLNDLYEQGAEQEMQEIIQMVSPAQQTPQEPVMQEGV